MGRDSGSDSSDTESKGNKQLLTGSKNYRQWARTREIKLETKGVWDYVDGSRIVVEKPEELAAAPTAAEEAAYEKAEKKYRAYQKGKMKAVDLIWNYVHEDLQAEIEDTKDPKEMWNRLKKEYGTNSEGRGVLSQIIRAEMANLRYEFQTDVDRFMNKFVTKANQLKSIEDELKDSEMISFLFSAMPPELNPAKSAYRATTLKNTTKWKTVMEVFRAEIL